MVEDPVVQRCPCSFCVVASPFHVDSFSPGSMLAAKAGLVEGVDQPKWAKRTVSGGACHPFCFLLGVVHGRFIRSF